MVLHHIFNESDATRFCPYCRNEISDPVWESNFRTLTHYKEIICNCGKKLTIKVDFFGSGHDTWQNSDWQRTIKESASDGRLRTLESQIRIIEKEK